MIEKTSLRKLLLIQRSEIDSVKYLFIYSFLLGFSQIATITSSSTLLLTFYDPEFIPTIFLINGLIITTISTLFLLFLNKNKTKHILILITISMIVGTLVITLLNMLFPHIEQLAAGLFFWSRVESTFLAVSFLIVANNMLAPRTSRRVLAFAASGQVIPIILGGLLFPYILHYLHPIHLMWFSILSHIMLFIHVKSYSEHRDDQSNIHESRRSSLIFSMVLTLSLAYLLYYIIDSSFLAIVDMTLVSAESLGTFFSRFWLVVGISALLCKTLVSGKLLYKLGIQVGLVTPPLLLLLLFFLKRYVNTPFQLIISLKFIERVFFTSIFIPAFYTLFQAFRYEIKQKNQLILETIIPQVMGFLTGLIFIVFKQEEVFSINTVLQLMVIISILLMFSSIFTHRSYVKKMLNLVKRPDIKLWEQERVIPKKREKDGMTNIYSLMNRLKHFSQDRPEEKESITYDVWLFEWNRLTEGLLIQLSEMLSDTRVLDRWYKIRDGNEDERVKLIEGYTQLLPPHWREPVISIINMDEPYLITRSLKKMRIDTEEGYRLSESNTNLTKWTQTVLSRGQDDELLDIKNSQFFSKIPTEYLHTLLPSFKLNRYIKDDYIISEGDSGDSMYIQISGQCNILSGNQRVTEISRGSCVGELALIVPEKRSASIIAISGCEFLELPGSEFISFIERYPTTVQNIQTTLFLRMQALIGGGLNSEITSVEQYITDISMSINNLKLIKLFNNVSTEILQDLSLNIEYIDLDAGDYYYIDREDPPLIIIKSGELIEYWGDKEVKSWVDDSTPALQHLIQHSKYCGKLEIVRRTSLILISSDVYNTLLRENSRFQHNLLKELVEVNRLLLNSLKLKNSSNLFKHSFTLM